MGSTAVAEQVVPVEALEEKFRAAEKALLDAHEQLDGVLSLVLKMTNHEDKQNVSLEHLGSLTFWEKECRQATSFVVIELDKIAGSAYVDLVATVREGGTSPNVPLYDESGVRNYDDDYQGYSRQ
jgi:hypothetical protein